LFQIKRALELGFIKIMDIRDNPKRFFLAMELFGYVSSSMGIKSGVQFILWGGSLMFLV
jgi:hypothetical protein